MLTERATGSNYAINRPKTEVYEDLEHGPWSRHPDLPLPDTYILVKTHCGGYCDDCHPLDYVQSLENFASSCTTCSTNDSDGKRITYPDAYNSSSLVRRVIHLIRDPFDNLISRIHLARKLRPKQWPDNSSEAEAYKSWCWHLDHLHKGFYRNNSTTFSVSTLDLFRELPCFAEWYRYIQWHNHALDLLEKRLQVPVHTLYYEDYSLHFSETVNELLQFLQLKAVAGPRNFHAGKSYRYLFSNQEKRAARILVQSLAKPATWKRLQHYFSNAQDEGKD